MTGEEICALAETLTEDLSIDRTMGLGWINDCLRLDLGKDMAYIDGETVTITSVDTWTATSKTYLEMLDIRATGSTTPYFGTQYGSSYRGSFDVKQGYIRLPVTGAYVLTGYTLPPEITTIGTEVSGNEIFHYAIARYVAWRALAQDDEENPAATTMRDEYYYYKRQCLRQIDELTPRRPRFVKARLWN